MLPFPPSPQNVDVNSSFKLLAIPWNIIPKATAKPQYPFKWYEKAPSYLSKFETNARNEWQQGEN